jgi:guanine deaminase
MLKVIELAVNNVTSKQGGPYAALIVKNEQIIAQSANLVTATNDPTAHAEIMAIRTACRKMKNFQLENCTLYSSCEPCPMCLGAVYWARLQHVFYACTRLDAAKAGFDDNFIYDDIALAPAQRHINMQQIMMRGADKPFQAWQQQQDKICY